MATKKIVGKVLPEERDEIQQLFERACAYSDCRQHRVVREACEGPR